MNYFVYTSHHYVTMLWSNFVEDTDWNKSLLCLLSKCVFAFAKKSTITDLKEKQGKCFTLVFVVNI